MITNDPKIYALMYGNIVEHVARDMNISIREARIVVSNMSFGEYHSLLEATLIQPTNTFSTIKPTYPNPIQVKQTREPQPGTDDPELFGTMSNLEPSLVRGQKLAAKKDQKATVVQAQADKLQADKLQTNKMQREDITPPSGDTIGPGNNSSSSGQPSGLPSTANSNIKSLWPGKGVPAAVGMTVGLKGPSGLPVPGMITQVDNAAKGAKVKNPTTGQEEWTNLDALEPYIATGQHQSQAAAPLQPDVTDAQRTMEDVEILNRMRELAGIKETCSAGATGAGSIAVAPAAMGTMKRRIPPTAELKHEYTPKGPVKTIVGDTKPHQATGELSANLAATGKPAASRTNNGRKRRR